MNKLYKPKHIYIGISVLKKALKALNISVSITFIQIIRFDFIIIEKILQYTTKQVTKVLVSRK